VQSEILLRLRDAELECVTAVLPAHSTVLEVGAGNGHQAAVLTRLGHRVLAIDVRRVGGSGTVEHPVVPYDGERIPVRSGVVDVVFSSHVLEHVKRLDRLTEEFHRVLRPGGIWVHVLPSASWRLWTSLFHYLHYARLAVLLPGRRRVPVAAALPGASRGAGYWGRVLLAERHGETGTAVGELLLFRRRAWHRLLVRCAGGEVHGRSSGLYYSGYGILGSRMGIGARRRAARLLGSSSHIFIVRPARAGNVPEGNP
jgi:SAM-dependent methyltransferase